MATETEFNLAVSQFTTAFDAAFTAINGVVTLQTTATLASEAKAEQVRVWKETIVSGGVVIPPAPPAPSPSPAPNATIAALKVAMAAAPTTHAAIPTTTSGTVILGTIGDKLTPSRIPGANGGYVRHWMQNGTSGGGNNGGKTADLFTVAKVETLSSLGPAVGGLAELVTADGSSRIKAYSAGGAFSETSGSIADSAIGFTLTGRAFAVSSRFASSVGHVYVSENGSPLTLCAQKLTWPESESYCYYDAGTVATRSYVVVLQANIEWGDIAVAPDAVMSPYDWTTNKFLYGFMGDSWGQTLESVRGFSLPQATAKLLCPAPAIMVGSTIGGTGFIANTGGTQPPGTNVTRLAAWTSGTPLLLDCSLIVNDNITDPTALRNAVDTVLSAGRAASPNALILVTLWNSQGSRSTNTSGNEYQKMVIIRERARLLSGKWIILNAFDGIWETSDGTTKATPSGPMITGEGSVASPTGTGNADTWIDNNSGRHPTSVGVIGIANYKAAMVKEALASMSSSSSAPAPAPAPSPGTTLTTETFDTNLGSFTAVNSAARSTVNPIKGAGSVLFGTNGYLTRAGYDLGTGDWTIEVKIRHPGQAQTYTNVFTQRLSTTNGEYDYDMQMFFAGNALYLNQQGRANVGGETGGYADGQEHQIAIVCLNQIVTLYFDRVKFGTQLSNAIALPGTGRVFTLGGDPSSTGAIYFEGGTMDDFRVSAYARYTGDSYTAADE